MADDPTPQRTDVRAGGLLDLSTGPPAPPPPPPAPRPPVVPDPEVRAGRTLDLSVKPAGPASKKPAAPDFGGLVLRETVDLSTKRAPAEASAAPVGNPAKAAAPTNESRSRRGTRPQDGGRGSDHRGSDSRGSDNRGSNRDGDSRDAGRGRSKGDAPASASSSLADLLDPDVLAKLRGG